MNRRQAIKTIAASSSLVLGGCLSGITGSPDEGRAQIGAIPLVNRTDQTLSMTVWVERDGEVIHEKTHEVPPTPAGVEVEQTWPCEPAKFVIRAKGPADDAPTEEVFTEEKAFDPFVTLRGEGWATIVPLAGENKCSS